MQVTEEEKTKKVTGLAAGMVNSDRDCLCNCGVGDSLHALGSLPGDVDELDHFKLGLNDVQVVVQTGTFTPLGHNGQLGLGGVAHEQQDVHMTRFPVANTHTQVDKTVLYSPVKGP